MVRPRLCLCATSRSSLVFIEATSASRCSILLFSLWRVSVSVRSIVNYINMRVGEIMRKNK